MAPPSLVVSWRERRASRFCFVCEFCGSDMDLRVYAQRELGKHTYAYCTLAGCHWWLEF